MFINHFLWWVILIAILLASTILLAIIAKLFKNSGSRAIDNFFSIFYMILLAGEIYAYNHFSNIVYVIKSRNEHVSHYLLGSKQYQLKNGVTINLTPDSKCLLVNDYDTALYCQEKEYSTYSRTKTEQDRSESFPAFSATPIKHKIHYFPDEETPYHISKPFFSFGDVSRYKLYVNNY